MKREIKFRAWNEKMKKFSDPYIVSLDGLGNVEIGGAEVNFIIIQFFTGLHDKNGKEIYEGDVIECTLSPSDLPHQGVVVYDNTYCSFATENEAGTTLFYHHNINTRKIIGNVYETPELLKPTSMIILYAALKESFIRANPIFLKKLMKPLINQT